ncbi:iron ABC transporter permease [uncultured Salinibacterium sp.]|uniref:FecCD family ABC transporter permease n=1 Tax=uncultured Salinibacterium sp. TaxID=459274 RepID=UPI0030DCE0CE|tara:strand:- start:33634 stop:34941 length:1308 start_codon:yes stop_codon:yes gene_type:complete
MSLSDLARLTRRATAASDDGPSRSRIKRRHAIAVALDAALVLTPLAVGGVILGGLLSGGTSLGSADVAVFAAAAILLSLAVGLGPVRSRVASRAGRPVIAQSTRQARLRVIMFLALVVVLLALASLAIGSRALGIGEVLTALLPPYGESTTDAALIVRELRAPRTVLGLAVGAALGVAGATIQGHTRNPLADPGLLGVSAGATCAVVLGIFVLGLSTPLEYIWLAFAGALLASLAVFTVAAVSGGSSPLTLILTGAVLSAILASVTSAIVLIDEASFDVYRFWVVGSLAGRDSDILLPLLPFIVAGLILALACAPGLNLLATGGDVARALGLNVTVHRMLGIASITLLAGAATAACGPIGFIGLVAPHVARALVGNDYRWSLPVAALSGAALLLAGDVVGRVVARPAELQVGIVVALIGAPFLVALIRRRKLTQL